MNEKTDISVVIVSYKCLPVLRMALASILEASDGISVDTYVVDNMSEDGTVEHLREKCPWVEVIDAGANLGFSRANNLALEKCRGGVILILNPDTIIPNHFLKSVVDHFKENPGGGALGVNMTNGYGSYLMESKRGYPGVRTSFFKLSGLWHLAPKSKFFNNYYVGNLSKDETGEVPILSGACMAFTRGMMQKAGVFDPMFFMYGEDIDLSWRMHVASDGNVYRGDLKMIHFKGVSTPQHMKYIYHFYDAMLLFASKHEREKHNIIVNLMVALGIWVGLLFAAVKCVVMRNIYRMRRQSEINRVLYIGDSKSLESFQSRVGIESISVELRDVDVKCRKGDAMVFDIDRVDKEMMIGYMQNNPYKYIYGFYSDVAKECFVFCNNGYKVLWEE